VKIDLGNEVIVELLVEGDRVRGLGEISVRGVALRCGRLPIAPLIDTPEGLRFRDFTLVDVIRRDDETIVRCRVKAEQGDYTGHTDLLHHRRVVTRFPDKTPVADIDWVLRPDHAEIGGRPFAGLSYAYRFRCPDETQGRVHRVVDRASWEIGGAAEGNTIISAGQANHPEHRATRNSAFDTRVARRGLNGERLKPGSVSYETGPRFGVMQWFDYLFADAGALAVFYARMEHIRGLVDKREDSDLILHFDEIHFALTNEFETPAKRVLFHAPTHALDITEGRNIWTDVGDYVAHVYRSQYGIRAEEPVPEAAYQFSYDHRMRAHLLPADPADHFRRLGREFVPRVAELGIRRIFIGPPWINDMTEEKETRNCCVTLEYRVADRFGGEPALADLCRAAEAAGVQITLWFGWATSTASPITLEHPEWRVISVTGAHYNGGYRELFVHDPRSGFRDYLAGQLTGLRRRTGYHAVWHDSFVHLPTMVVNYADERLEPSLDALLGFVADLQREGLVHTIEGNGPFGLPVGGLPHDADDGAEVMLQWFFGHEYALYNTARSVKIEAVAKGILTPKQYFRFLANKAPFRFDVDADRVDQLQHLEGEFARLHKIFNQVSPLMQRRHILDDDAGVAWRTDDGEQVLFAFKEFRHPVPEGCRVEEVTDADPIPIAVDDGAFQTREEGVYRFRPVP